MKLMSMTSFVLEQKQSESFNENTFINTELISLEKIRNYAKFLKQPLKIEMFVPCDEEGNFLEEPIFHEPNNENEIGNYQILIDEYYEAKAKVLFEGFCINGEDESIITLEFENTWIEFYKEHEVFMCDNHVLINLEDLSNFELQLTESALKQIGL